MSFVLSSPALLTVAQVTKVYTARREGCRCGCIGKYYYPNRNLDAAAEKRCYAIAKHEISNRMVTQIVNMLNANRAQVEAQDGWYNLTCENGHVYTAYTN
jgi:hypothetical protein